ncbi:MAG: ABC transporter substrate-binding protein, partial [Thermoprotei archaeon]
MDKRIVAVAIVVAVAVAGYFAYTQFFQQTPQEKVLIIARTNKPSSLDPAYIVWTNDYAIGANIYSTLIGYKPGTREMYGDLAESWEVSENGTVYIFHLRKGVKFHKGYGELKASDVKFTFERILDPKTNARYPDFFKSIDHIEVIDDYTIKFVLKYPDSAFLTYIAPWRNSFIVSQKAVEELGKDFSFNPVGTGPFMFESWDSETGDVVLVANPDYYGEKPKVDKVIYKVIEDPYTAYLALERGEVDIVTLDTSISGLLERAKSNPNIKVYEKISGGSLSLTFNLKHPILKDVRVRRAIAYAINKTEI